MLYGNGQCKPVPLSVLLYLTLACATTSIIVEWLFFIISHIVWIWGYGASRILFVWHFKRVMKGLPFSGVLEIYQHVTSTLRAVPNEAFTAVSSGFTKVVKCMLQIMENTLKSNKHCYFVAFIFFILWYH